MYKNVEKTLYTSLFVPAFQRNIEQRSFFWNQENYVGTNTTNNNKNNNKNKNKNSNNNNNSNINNQQQ